MRGAAAAAVLALLLAGLAIADKLPLTRAEVDAAHRDPASACTSCHPRVHASPEHPAGYPDSECRHCHDMRGPSPRPPLGVPFLKAHGRDGDYVLAQGHKNVPCAACHVGHGAKFAALPTQCTACHEDSAHRGARGPECASCHRPGTWGFRVTPMDRDPGPPSPRVRRCAGCHAREPHS